MLGLLQKKLAEYIRANIVAYFFLTLIFAIGITLGALAVKTLPDAQKMELADYLRVFFQGLAENTSLVDTPSFLLTVVLSNAKIIGLIWLLGFTIVGVPFVLFIVWLKGFIIGFTVGFLVDEYIMKGLLFAIAAVLPHNLFAAPAILAAAVAAVTFSLMLVKQNPQIKGNLFYASLAYSAVCLVMLFLAVLAALVEVYISPVFMKLTVGLFV